LLSYRKELDGLRAVAVIPVIMFHAGLFGFSGGYAGVDIFFVISGYLITNILLKELKDDRFSLVNFYQRRARRILPALFVMIFITTILALLVMPTEQLKSYANSVLSVITFTSNIHFYVVSDYFSTTAEQKPLLHTWSLAIEEQYYLFFPLLLSFFITKKNQLKKVLIALTLISLATAQILTISGYTESNFYLIFSRAWELFVGSLLALYHLDRRNLSLTTKNLLSVVGLICIISSFFLFDDTTPFPSLYTLLPVLGACLIITCATPNNIVGKLLSSPLFSSIGLISYSLYLWHQPIFSFLRMKTFGEPTNIYFLMAIGLTFICAFLSYKLVETPFRKNKKLLTINALKVSAQSMGVLIVLAASILLAKGFPERFDNAYEASIKASPLRGKCHTSGHGYLKPKDSCRYPNQNTSWAMFGDSHMVELAYALSEQLALKNDGLLHLTFSGCAPALNFEVKKTGCHSWVRESLDYLIERDDIKNVIVGFRSSAFLFGEHDDIYPNIPSVNANHRLSEAYNSLPSIEAANLYWSGYKVLIDTLLKYNKKVFVVYPIPEIPDDIHTILTPFSIFGGSFSYDLYNTTSNNYYLKRNEFILGRLNTLPYSSNLIAVKPTDILCHQSGCAAVLSNKAMYFDNNHLSIEGARKVISLFPPI
tara:strand:+ start:898 stop:2853 length:1956 start_codon:yes stop_codon:yes gene_type:complete